MTTLGREIKKARIDQGYRQCQLCAAAGITQKYLSEIENDHVDPRFSIVQRIARALGVGLTRFDTEDLGRQPSSPATQAHASPV
jgi:transcriptional regulator with XRE-family HTH domain